MELSSKSFLLEKNNTENEDTLHTKTTTTITVLDKDSSNKNNLLNETYKRNKEEREILTKRIDSNLQNFKSVDTYLESMKIEFNDYLLKYDNLYSEISKNTLDYFNVFEQMMHDFSGELSSNSTILTDMFSKMNLLAVEMSELEELYEKVREMRNGLEIVYKQIKK